MNERDEQIKWRVMTRMYGTRVWSKRGLFETRRNAIEKRDWFQAQPWIFAKVVRHVVKRA